jgi:MoaA/NifB/PqqE/SkfB family radical SAM enzyme
MFVQGLGLYYTMRCNAACAHCGVWSSPDRKESMVVDQAKRYIAQLADLGKSDGVVFVGGEPLLYLDDICELIQYTRSFSIKTQVSTNAFWAASDAKANYYLQRLVDAGLDQLALSADSYHSEFIDPKNVGRALRLARNFGLVRKLHIVRSRINAEEEALYVSTGIDPVECLDALEFKLRRHEPDFDPRPYIIVHRMSVAPFGRAAFLRGHTELFALDELEEFPCYMVGKFPLIYPNGNLFACCCIAGSYRPYYVGNVDSESLGRLAERMIGNVVYQAISKVGPVALAKSCQIDAAVPGREFANACHACRETFARTDLVTLENNARGLLFMYDLMNGAEQTAFDLLL